MDDTFDPNERSKQKQASRDADIARLKSGEISASELNKENGLFSCFDLSKARILHRRRKLK